MRKLNKKDRRELDNYDFQLQIDLVKLYEEVEFDVNDYYFDRDWGYLISRLPPLDSQVRYVK